MNIRIKTVTQGIIQHALKTSLVHSSTSPLLEGKNVFKGIKELLQTFC